MATTNPVGSERDWRERVVAYSCRDTSADERTAVEAHLAECPACREALAAYERFDLLARSPLRLDAVEPASLRAEAPRTVAMEPEAALISPARTSTPAPTIRPLPAWQAPYFAQRLVDAARNRANLALPAVSAVLAASLILVAFAALLLPRLSSSSSQSTDYSPSVMSIAMASEDEGWAGSVSGTLWHYSNGHWGTVPDPFVDSGGGSQPFGEPGEGVDFQRLAPNDIWAGYGRSIYHYDGQQWRIVYTLPSTDATVIRSISMSSSDDGWAVGSTLGSDPHPAALRYHNGTWTHVSLDPAMQASALQLWYVTAVSADEAWANGTLPPDGASVGGPASLLHYAHGQWQQAKLPSTFDFLGKPAMSGPNDGWMPAMRNGDAPGKNSGALLHYANGVWQIAQSFGAGTWIDQVALTSPSEGWAVGTGLWRYADGAWKSVALPAGAAGADVWTLSLISADEGWAGGYNIMLQLHNGVWTRYGKPYPQQVSGTPTPIPACATPASSTSAIRPGGFGAPWVSLLDRWGEGSAADGGGEYLGTYTDTGTPHVYVDNAGIAAESVSSLVYLVDSSQHISTQDARNLAASILPRDATLYPAGNDLLEPADGTAEVYCSPAFLKAEQMQQPANPNTPPSVDSAMGMIFVSYVARDDGSIDRIAFSS